MKRFKLRTGKHQVFSLTREIYEEETQLQPPYREVGQDRRTRYLAVCPSCDNPIQIIGLYSKADNSPSVYGKHYNKDTKFAKYNEQAYYFCPYAAHRYQVTAESRKEHLTDYERNVYNILRDNFDIAINIIQQDTGIFISEKMARQMLFDFCSCEGHMYYWATIYNAPWLLLFFLSTKNCYGLLIDKESRLYEILSQRPEIRLVDTRYDRYKQISGNGSFLNMSFKVLKHKRSIVDDRLKESMSMNFIQTTDYIANVLFSMKIEINEYRFLNWISSEKAQKYRGNTRNQRLLQIAREMMPDL